jgi:hypothetical protein
MSGLMTSVARFIAPNRNRWFIHTLYDLDIFFQQAFLQLLQWLNTRKANS